MRRLAGRVTVLREGRVVAVASVDELDRDGLAELVAGRRLPRADPGGTARGGRVVASIERLSGGTVQELSLDLREGEVVGLTGPVGSGFDEVPDLVFRDEAVPERARLAPRRDDAAGAGSLSVADNVTLPTLDRYVSRRRLDRGRMLRETAERLVELQVRPPDPRLAYGVLSGGNRRKTLIARALNAGPRLLLLEEPLRGVDVGARRQIVQSIRQVALSGCGVVCASSERTELLELCDRVLVFSDGVVVATQTRATGP